MKTAVVTGGSGYVGSAVTQMLRTHGFDVFNIGREICDVRDATALTQITEKILEERGAPDCVIHMASMATTRKALEDTTEKEVADEFAVTVTAAEILANTFLPHMKHGSLFLGITTASLDKAEPEKNIGAYIPAKQKLRELLSALREQWSEKGIRVYEIAPPFLPGGLNKNLPEGVRNLLARRTDGTVPTAEDVAREIEALM